MKRAGASKRYDAKGRVLNKGEYQKANGMYEYRFTDNQGNAQSVYSWCLFDTDVQPEGKQIKTAKSLRTLEQEIINAQCRELNTSNKARKMLLNDLWPTHIQNQKHLKDSTRANYMYMYDKYIRGAIGDCKVKDITYSQILSFYNSLIDTMNFKPNSMEVIHTILHPLFDTAVKDGYRSTNPTDGAIKKVKQRPEWKSGAKREALTEEEQKIFMDYVSNSDLFRHWLPLFTVMLGTGARVGEIIGLRPVDCDFRNNEISINHSLVYRPESTTKKCVFHVSTPKTKNSVRKIPMMPQVKEALLTEIEKRTHTPCNSVIDGMGGFIFTTRFDEVISPHNINRAIERITNQYNEEEKAKAQEEKRMPKLLPHFTCHNLRHTFATRMCESVSDEVSLKAVQSILGHASFETTMDVYAHASAKKNQIAMSAISKMAVFA